VRPQSGGKSRRQGSRSEGPSSERPGGRTQRRSRIPAKGDTGAAWRCPAAASRGLCRQAAGYRPGAQTIQRLRRTKREVNAGGVHGRASMGDAASGTQPAQHRGGTARAPDVVAPVHRHGRCRLQEQAAADISVPRGGPAAAAPRRQPAETGWRRAVPAASDAVGQSNPHCTRSSRLNLSRARSSSYPAEPQRGPRRSLTLSLRPADCVAQASRWKRRSMSKPVLPAPHARESARGQRRAARPACARCASRAQSCRSSPSFAAAMRMAATGVPRYRAGNSGMRVRRTSRPRAM